MELDSLKNEWKQQKESDLKTQNTDIMELVKHKSYGPLASLKRTVQMQIWVAILLIGMYIPAFITNPDRFHSPVMWIGFAAVFIIIVHVLFNWTFIRNMEKENNSIKDTFAKNLNRLENGWKFYNWVGMGLSAAFIFAIEFDVFSIKRELFGLGLLFRCLIYITLFVLFYFLSKYQYQRQFGSHIDFIKDILAKMR